MPYDQDDADQRISMARFRKQLIETTDGVDLPVGRRTPRISNVPLFKNVDGVLKQAIRVRLDPGPALSLTARKHGQTIASLQTTSRDVPQSGYLLVSEVESDETITVQVENQTIDFTVTPQRKFSVHLVHHSHYDIGYTDPQAIVNANQLAYIDNAIDLAHATSNWSEESRFRWNIEVNWPLREWLRTRPKSRRDALMRLVGEGRIEVHALPFSMHTEAYSHDELARQLEFTAELRRTYGLEIISAMQTDVPGATIGLSSLLTDAGIKYLAVAHNYAGRSIPFLTDGQALKRPFWWRAPDGEKLLVWYTDTLFGIAYMEAVTLGIGKNYNEFLGSLPEYLNALTQQPYPYLKDLPHSATGSGNGIEWKHTPYKYDVLHFRVQSTFADNAAPSLASAEIARDWNAEWTWPRVHASTDRRFFEDILDRHGDVFETYSGDWTDWWADGIGSAARELGINRNSQAEIQTSQTLHALADVLTDEPNASIQSDIQLTYDEMALFDEHTWGSGNPWENQAISYDSGELQWMHKASFAHRASERSLLLLDAGLQRMADFAAAPISREKARSLIVFNPSSWARTDLVRVFIPEDILAATAYNVFDPATGEQVPVEFEAQTNWTHRARGVNIHFLARDVPATGYARYEIVPVEQTPSRSDAAEGGNEIGWGRLRVTITPETANITSVIDTASNRELVAGNALLGFNTYIHDRYATAPTFNHLSGRIDNAGPWLLGARGAGQFGLVTKREANEVWDRLTMRYAGQGADWLETTLTLPHGTSRLHISNRLHKPATLEKESVYFAFPFAGNPDIHLEITGGVVGPDSPHVPGSANHFRAMRHWATVSESGQSPVAWATREAPLVQLGNIAIPYAPFPKSIEERHAHPATIYSWALNNLWDTNFPVKQGGELTFNYLLALGDDDNAASLGRDTGATIASPLVGIVASAHSATGSDSKPRGSFVTVGDANVEILHLRQAPGANGVAVMVQSHGHEPLTTRLRPGDLQTDRASIGNFLGEHLEPARLENGEFRFSIDPGELKMIVLHL